MYQVVYGDLFDFKETHILAHACNCRGCWGSGVAALFAKHFPEEYEDHKGLCMNVGDNLAGTAMLTEHVLCLFTSRNYGKKKDTEKKILEHTERALEEICYLADYRTSQEHQGPLKVAAPQINAGLFAVPWEKTEELLKRFLGDKENIEWTTVILK